MRLLQNLHRKYKDLLDVVDYVRWLFALRRKPLEVGSTFHKREGDYIVYYEVIGYGYSPGKEVVEEISRKKIE